MRQRFILTLFAIVTCLAAPAKAQDASLPYDRWYGGSWQAQYEDADGNNVTHALHLERNTTITGCMLYGESGNSTDLYIKGHIISSDRGVVRVRWDTGEEALMTRIGQTPDNGLMVEKAGLGLRDKNKKIEFKRSFLPLKCVKK